MTPHKPRAPKKPSRPLPRLFYRWHRRIGASAALFLIWIVISGWLLNHSDSLGLAELRIQSPLLAHWYNLDYTPPRQVFESQHHWLVLVDDNPILDGKALAVKLTALTGLAESGPLIALADQHQLFLFTGQGELIDKLADANLPLKDLQRIGTGCTGIAISDNIQTLSTADGIDWQPCATGVSWAAAQAIKPAQLAQVEPLLIPRISAEKLLIDLHTGRFFGRYGALVVDLIGGCLLLLALSGLWLFFRINHKKIQR